MDVFVKPISENVLAEQIKDALGIVKTRVAIFFVAPVIFVFIRKATPYPVPNQVFLLLGVYFALSLIFWLLLAKWKNEPRAALALEIGKGYFLIETVLNLFIIYYFSPVLIYLFGSSIWLAFFVYTFYSSAGIGAGAGYSYSRAYVDSCFILSCICCAIIFFWEYSGIAPTYQFLPSLNGFFYQKAIPSLMLFIGLIAVFGAARAFSSEIWKKLKQNTEELAKLNEGLETMVQARTQELEVAKNSLEIQVKARTQELEDLTKSLNEQVKERTKDLQKRIEELEKFNKLTVGRELQMIALKEEVERLEKELKKEK